MRDNMNLGDKIEALIRHCKGGIYININEHTDDYMTVAKKLEEYDRSECPPETTPLVRAKMIEAGTMIRIQFYPDTPIGSYEIFHYDLEAALDSALECLD